MTVMKVKVVTDTKPAVLNTEKDICLYSALRPSSEGSEGSLSSSEKGRKNHVLLPPLDP